MFDLTFVGSTIILNGLAVLSIFFIVVGISINKLKPTKKQHFKKPIIIFYLGLLINLIIMYFANNISIYDSIFSMLNFLGLLLYFFLHKYKFDKNTLLKTTLFFAGIVSLLMIIQQINPDSLLFNQLLTHETFVGNRGIVRVRIPGMAFVVISCFFLFYNFIKKNKLISFAFFIIFFGVIFIQGFRSITISMLICILFIYWKEHKKPILSIRNIFLLLLIVVGLFCILQIDYINNLFNQLLITTVSDSENLENNIRLETWQYYMLDIKPNLLSYFTGSGLRLPFETPEKLFAVDLGIFGFYTLAGIIPTFALLWIFFKGLFMKIDKEFIFISTFFLYLLINSFLFNAEAFRTGIFLILSICLYFVDIIKSEQTSNTEEKNEY